MAHLSEAVENRHFTMIQLCQAEHSATVVQLHSRFARDNGLRSRIGRNTANPAQSASSDERWAGSPETARSKDDGHQQSRDSKKGLRAKMGTRDRKARLAVLEKTHAPAAGLPDV